MLYNDLKKMWWQNAMVETYHERRNCLKNKKRQKESEEYRKYTDTTKCIFGSPKTG